MILGTAGHIDHGKTTLVRALTGVDTDRLPEEKRRGITIELGFAPLHVEGIGTIGIVDVPGHEAFVRTMLAGASGVDLALLVIAADEGLMPQTREHLAILRLLGVAAGVVALTKCDLADAEWIQLVEDEVRSALADGPLAGAPIVRVSSTTGTGLDSLRAAIARAADSVPARAADDLFRMQIDRAFSVKGTGTVVTGTVWSGSVATDAQVQVRPGNIVARVRGIESHGAPVTSAASGMRAAIALAGVDRDRIQPRGTVLTSASDPWVESLLLRADVALLDGAPTLSPRSRVRLHLGTAEVGARIVAVGRAVAPGAPLPVRVVLDAPIVARAGDRFVLRSASPVATIGGGVVTDPAPGGRRVRPWPAVGATTADRLSWIVAEGGGAGVPLTALSVRLGVRPAAVPEVIASARGLLRVGDRLFAREVADLVRARIIAAVKKAHRERPLDPGVSLQALRDSAGADPSLIEHEVAELARKSKISLIDGVVATAGWTPGGSAADRERVERILTTVQAGATQPPSVGELTEQFGAGTIPALKLLARRGDLIAVSEDRYFATAAASELVGVIRRALAGGVAATASELREATGLTRKYLIPFLEYCDRSGVTQRRGDTRVLPGDR